MSGVVGPITKTNLTCLRALKPKGRLINGVQHYNPSLYKTDAYITLYTLPHHIGLWNRHSLENLAEFNKLKVESVKIEPCTELNCFFAIKFAYLRLHDGIVNLLNFLKYSFEGRNLIDVLVKQ